MSSLLWFASLYPSRTSNDQNNHIITDRDRCGTKGIVLINKIVFSFITL